MSTGETAILIAVVLGVLLTMTGVMVRYSTPSDLTVRLFNLTLYSLALLGSWVRDLTALSLILPNYGRVLAARLQHQTVMNCNDTTNLLIDDTTRLRCLDAFMHYRSWLMISAKHTKCILTILINIFNARSSRNLASYLIINHRCCLLKAAYSSIPFFAFPPSIYNQHGCQIAIQSFHDCGCAEEVLISTLSIAFSRFNQLDAA